MSNPII